MFVSEIELSDCPSRGLFKHHGGTVFQQPAKAERYLQPEAFGVLYCNEWHAFTTPFIVKSRADQNKVVMDIWPEPWRLPFKIKTLGTLSRRLPMKDAAERWPTLKIRLAENNGRGGVSAAFNITGTTVFVPVAITPEDWGIICSDLGD